MKTWLRILDAILRITAVATALLLLLTGCTKQMTASIPTEPFTHGVYEFTFAAEQTAGEPTDAWEFAYTYNGETITSGYQILFSLEIFTFHSMQVDVIEKDSPNNKYSATFPVAICAVGSGKTELTVTDSDGKATTFKIACQVTQTGKR